LYTPESILFPYFSHLAAQKTGDGTLRKTGITRRVVDYTAWWIKRKDRKGSLLDRLSPKPG
jgi:hypothetical protein